jgi:hypothetical protein
VTDYYEQSVISNYQALIDRHRLSNILRVVCEIKFVEQVCFFLIATCALTTTADTYIHPPQPAAGDSHPKRRGEFQGVGAALLEAADQVHDARHRAGDI